MNSEDWKRDFAHSNGTFVDRVVRMYFDTNDVVSTRGTEEDLNGTDFIVNSHVSVDVKVRSKDYGDELLELRTREFMKGWTVSETKKTEIVLFYHEDTGRATGVFYKPLRSWAIENRDMLSKREKKTEAGEYGVPVSLAELHPFILYTTAIRDDGNMQKRILEYPT